MPSFVYMKILESTPERYDRGIQILSHGRINEIYENIAESVSGKGKKVLDIGCGTGNLTIACAEKGASVTGIDVNAGMLEVAGKKAYEAGLSERIEFLELGIAEIRGRIGEESLDACVSCLTFSELSDDEIRYAITTAYSLLKPGGTFIIADEAIPQRTGAKLLHSLVNLPSKILAYIVSQATTRPLKDLSADLRNAGFVKIESSRLWNDSFVIIKGTRGEDQ